MFFFIEMHVFETKSADPGSIKPPPHLSPHPPPSGERFDYGLLKISIVLVGYILHGLAVACYYFSEGHHVFLSSPEFSFFYEFSHKGSNVLST